jgi:DNA modification methylase
MSIQLPSKSNPVLTLHGDCRQVLKSLPANSVHCIVTSPPYWGLRSYLDEDDPLKPLEIGSEKTISEYVEKMVQVFRELKRVLREDGTCWGNWGDTYASAWAVNRRNEVGNGSLENGKREARPNRLVDGLKEKDLCGVPWRVALALQADGWYLRSDIIWHKPNPMPESVTDRPTKSHEYISS